METNQNNNEERLFDLLESKSWEALTAEEQAFVIQHLSEKEYMLQREIIAESASLYESDAEPLPLYIQPVRRKSFVQRTIPLYQAIAAVAAVVLVFLLIRPQAGETVIVPGKTEPQQQAKTEKEYIYDTIVEYVTVTRQSTAKAVDTLRKLMAFPEEQQPKMLEATNNVVVPEIISEKLETRGSSLKEDNTAHLAPRVSSTIY